ncbi:MAG: MATE family efflux transporter, partial [Deltaproteobacteria bacterium]
MRLAVPIMFGLVSIILFNVVDTFYIGMLGAEPLAAVSFTFPVVYVVMSVAFGLGIGTSAVIAHAIGEGDEHRVRRLTTDGLTLTLGVVLSIALAGLLSIEPLFRALGASTRLLPLIRDYMGIWYGGIGLLVIPIIGNSAIRATGDTKTPSIVMMTAGGVNALLDPFLIFGIGPFPRMELSGAALSTVASYTIAFAAAFWMLARREGMIDFSIPRFPAMLRSWEEILHIGLPAAGTNVLVPLSNGILTRIVSGFGAPAVAAFGVGQRVESLSMIGLMALSSVLTPFVGQNWGAGKRVRVRQGISASIRFSLYWGGGGFLLLALLADPIARVFTNDPAVAALIVAYLRIVPVSYGFFGIILVTNAAF